ncbi:hypothetical protein ACXAT3_003659 [Clostridium sporogenes]
MCGNSEITSNVKKGNNLKFAYNSSVKEDNLKFQLTDTTGKVIEPFETNKDSSKQVSLDKEEEYIFSATYNNFISIYKIDVNR